MTETEKYRIREQLISKSNNIQLKYNKPAGMFENETLQFDEYSMEENWDMIDDIMCKFDIINQFKREVRQ